MIHKVSILGNESIHLGDGIIDYIAQETIAVAPCSCYVIFTDTNVAPIYLDAVAGAFKECLRAGSSNSKLLTYSIAPGEIHKTRETKEALEDWLLGNKCTRDTCIIALGGGVVGDLVGIKTFT